MNTKKVLAMMLAVLMIVTATVAGTVAWLMDSTTKVENVFTTSDVDVELSETKDVFKMIPGHTIAKDPKVTVKANSEASLVFVKVTKENNADNYLVYAIDEGWTALDGVAGVYWREVTSSTLDQNFIVLGDGSYTDPMGTTSDPKDDVTVTWSDNQVAVKPSVTKTMMATAMSSQPKLSFTAYAHQLVGVNGVNFTPAQAWANLNPPTTP